MSEKREKRDAVPVRVPPAQRQRLKVLAAKLDRTLQEVTAEVVEDGLKRAEDALKKRGA